MKIEFDKGVSFTVTVDSMEQAIEAHRLLMEHFAKANGIVIPRLPKEAPPEPIVVRPPPVAGEWARPKATTRKIGADSFGRRIVAYVMNRLNSKGIACSTHHELGKISGIGGRNIDSIVLRTALTDYTLNRFTEHCHVTLDELRGLAKKGDISDRTFKNGVRKNKRKSMNDNTRVHDGAHKGIQ